MSDKTLLFRKMVVGTLTLEALDNRPSFLALSYQLSAQEEQLRVKS